MTERDISPDDLYAADECFLTGTAAEVISVTRIDGHVIGDGKPGPLTRKLLAAFRECNGNLSATERLLMDRGLRTSRRWLAVFLERWGAR